jgi:hypothetical protein
MTTPQQLGQITGSMVKEAVGARFVANIMARANRAGKFLGTAGVARRNKFVKSMENWLPVRMHRDTKTTQGAITSSQHAIPYNQLSRRYLEHGLYGIRKKYLPEIENAFRENAFRPMVKRPLVASKPFSVFDELAPTPLRRAQPRVTIGSNRRVLAGDHRPGYDQVAHEVASARSYPTLLHELGHAYTMPELMKAKKWQRWVVESQARAYSQGGMVVDKSRLLGEAAANRAAAQALRRLRESRRWWGQPQGALPTGKKFHDIVQPQMGHYNDVALAHYLSGTTQQKNVPGWIKRMGIPSRREPPSTGMWGQSVYSPPMIYSNSGRKALRKLQSDPWFKDLATQYTTPQLAEPVPTAAAIDFRKRMGSKYQRLMTENPIEGF